MKPVYSGVVLQTGNHNGGICVIEIAPKEWLQNDVVIDFDTAKILTPLVLTGTHSWLKLEFTPNSYDYDEKPKSGKSGTYYEVSAAGIINYSDAALQQALETIRYSQVVCKLTDRNKYIKLVGSKSFGMLLSITSTNTNKSNGEQTASLSFYLETEDAPPFYEA